ncbi:uncharacterized protein LACBIDRAFT_335959 [Laccaria bicolor S238N-H82]|uniref:Predicted protein n=1 Tax=Laccaria bicolor (strain S238N-H82 / ATCC MYA-4686) TaxID=486041 RepID=B0E3Y8_LACBS|nr:uncharacterized protein LACBIDRAFT_335959 [Laccaria bicolor S238N-H82]EDQ98441.1 predicted protein [Laccaria bicolor S238N-H82]|eukprot:XP_001890905.1 predicted protein [Laccaria bicolor S238N-H82]
MVFQNFPIVPETPGPQRGPKPSSVSCDTIKNARKAVSKLLQKHSLADTLMEIQRENLAAQKAQNQSHINLELHKQIIDEVKMGLWTIEQAQEKIEAIENDGSPRPAKHQKKVVQEFSPEEISSGSEDQ